MRSDKLHFFIFIILVILNGLLTNNSYALSIPNHMTVTDELKTITHTCNNTSKTFSRSAMRQIKQASKDQDHIVSNRRSGRADVVVSDYFT